MLLFLLFMKSKVIWLFQHLAHLRTYRPVISNSIGTTT